MLRMSSSTTSTLVPRSSVCAAPSRTAGTASRLAVRALCAASAPFTCGGGVPHRVKVLADEVVVEAVGNLSGQPRPFQRHASREVADLDPGQHFQQRVSGTLSCFAAGVSVA